MKKQKLYYIEPVTIPAQNAHSLQIANNLYYLKDKFDTTAISFNIKDQNLPFDIKHHKFVRPKYYNKVIPLSAYDMLSKIKNIKFDKNKDLLITRTPYYAYKLANKFKKVILELHAVPTIKDNKLGYFAFDLGLYTYPLSKIKKINNIEIVVISNGIKSKLLELGYKKDKITILHDGVNLEKFDINISKKDARKKLNLPQTKPIVSYVGTTDINRDIDTLIEVAKQMPSVNFVIYGNKKDYLEKASKELDNFYYMGYTTSPEIVYKASDILFAGYTKRIPTINYMSPLKIFEYMAAKRPMIVANFPRTREILKKDECVFYKSGNSIDLAKKIKIILRDNNLAKDITLNAFNKVKNYTWEDRIENMKRIYEK